MSFSDLQTPSQRLLGLDIARFIAFCGMVIVNFKVVMGAEEGTGGLSLFTSALEGRAAASFVVLAGIGLGLSSRHSQHIQTISVTLKRSLFLLVIGLVNAVIFSADILHYYAFYFFFGMLFLSLSVRALVFSIIAVNVLFIMMILVLNYDLGWQWETLSYRDFWSPGGFIRNLFFNGWHPVIPWISFFLVGILLSRLQLGTRKTQLYLIVFGAVFLLTAETTSLIAGNYFQPYGEDFTILFTTKPIPPLPLYILSGMGAAFILIGGTLMVGGQVQLKGYFSGIIPAGRQTLTLYIAHILVGMGVLEALNLLGGQDITTSVLAAVVFCALSAIYAWVWSKWFKRGPIEFLMRKIAG